MSLSYYDTERKPRVALARLWIFANIVLACAMSLYWTVFAVSVGEPFRWAMRDGVSPQPQLLEFPYMLLWSTPLICMMIGWAAMHLKQDSIARIVGGYPTMMLMLMVGWYNFAPSHWL
jgi:hypothetical protein